MIKQDPSLATRLNSGRVRSWSFDLARLREVYGDAANEEGSEEGEAKLTSDYYRGLARLFFEQPEPGAVEDAEEGGEEGELAEEGEGEDDEWQPGEEDDDEHSRSHHGSDAGSSD